MHPDQKTHLYMLLTKYNMFVIYKILNMWSSVLLPPPSSFLTQGQEIKFIVSDNSLSKLYQSCDAWFVFNVIKVLFSFKLLSNYNIVVACSNGTK